VRREWGAATIVGALLLLGGNGAVVWSELRVPSGLTALLVATVPIWMVLCEWLRPRAPRPGLRVFAGLLLGLVGLAILVGPGALLGAGGVDVVGALVLTLGSISWAVGSVYSRGAALPKSPLLATAMEMLAGGALLFVFGLLVGDAQRVDFAAITSRSLVALAYLTIFGSLIGFTAYIWLLGNTSAAKASTYAYVNPVVAVILGWALAGEPLTPRMLVAMVVIVGAVALITAARSGGGPPPRLASAVDGPIRRDFAAVAEDTGTEPRGKVA
jgi:drug/metabolite transporter (DMT)-like permease